MSSSIRKKLLCLDPEEAEALRRIEPQGQQLHVIASRPKALANSGRLHVTLVLREHGELCVNDLSYVVGYADKAVSRYVRQLRRAGRTKSRRDGKEIFYSLTHEGHALLDAVMALPWTQAKPPRAGRPPAEGNGVQPA